MKDTIAAVASGMTASGIGIIRISGPEAFAVLRNVFRPATAADPAEYKAGTIHYGHIVDPDRDGSVIDECLVMAMRAPHTFTTEDTVEINSHGGPFVMRKILSTVLANGARAAEPGEFTKRAYLGGRIDLSEAEAVMDVISARSDEALKSSMMQLSGSVRNRIRSIREGIMDELAYIEAALDDPEHMDLTGYPEQLSGRLAGIKGQIDTLMSTFGEGRVIREGILTVILGKPNAGKSSLLNALTGEDRAIVTDIEGTTRDILEEKIQLGGISLRVIDTAGIRESKDAIERIGIGRALEYAETADLILAIFDSSTVPDENDLEILRLIRDRKAIILLNKSDLGSELTTEESLRNLISGRIEAVTDSRRTENTGGAADIADSRRTHDNEKPCQTPEIRIIRISAKELTGLRELEQAVREMFLSGKLNFSEETVITNARHFEALKRAMDGISLVEKSIADGLPEDFYSIDLMDAYRALGEIIGEEVDDDLINTIFSKFCMGK